MVVVFRCIPCEACQESDELRRDPVIRDLLDWFVCVQIIRGGDHTVA
jgi:hypothetical protein